MIRQGYRPTLWRFLSLGGKLSRIIFIAFRGGSLKYGGSPSTISITIMPRDQISTCGSSFVCISCSAVSSNPTMWTVKGNGTCLWSIWESWDELRGHPIGRSYKRLSALHLFRDLGTKAKVWQLHLQMRTDTIKRGSYITCQNKWRLLFKVASSLVGIALLLLLLLCIIPL